MNSSSLGVASQVDEGASLVEIARVVQADRVNFRIVIGIQTPADGQGVAAQVNHAAGRHVTPDRVVTAYRVYGVFGGGADLLGIAPQVDKAAAVVDVDGIIHADRVN